MFLAAHVKGWSGWFCRGIPCIKLSTPTFTPEFNPIERLFNTLKRTIDAP